MMDLGVNQEEAVVERFAAATGGVVGVPVRPAQRRAAAATAVRSNNSKGDDLAVMGETVSLNRW